MLDFNEPPLKAVIEILLRDMNTGGNILFHGKELTKKLLPTIKPRALKDDAEKLLRTRTNAEVFTPSHVVKFMVDALDDGQIDSTWLEIACGEAPFITNRYDAETGLNVSIDERAGILDRKLSYTKTFDEAKRAVQSVYGYELQGDSLLIARANVLLTVADSLDDFNDSDLAELAEIIAWNFFQLDGTKDNGLFAPEIRDWQDGGRKFTFGGNTMKFDFIISNPPYQEDNGIDKSRKASVYDKFMEAAYKVGVKVELITPARFLFDAGGTPKEFNQRMLSDPHLKVIDYKFDAREYFKGVDIEGGVAITLRDETKTFGAIGAFIPFEQLKTIHQKVVVDNPNFRPLSEIIYTPIVYKFSEKFFRERPELVRKLQKSNDNSLRSNIFERLTEIFFNNKPNDGNEYIQIYGRQDNARVCKWFRSDYVTHPEPFDKWKVLVPKSNGSGAIGKVIPTPLIGKPVINSPFVGNTETYITVGAFDTRAEADACLTYIKSKFARAMLGILKVTQDNTAATWAKVPMQDFTPATSDIDWGGDVDGQLYRKYKLTAAEIKFIETHVKGMT
ncbi:MAG: Eco57I restriction-modification methylase domain-containing protein [Quinella sp. 1Q5]|nr:Eco57I restriction-modification methylase domain-containing protein [Quinella sp. 1Q5]